MGSEMCIRDSGKEGRKPNFSDDEIFAGRYLDRKRHYTMQTSELGCVRANKHILGRGARSAQTGTEQPDAQRRGGAHMILVGG